MRTENTIPLKNKREGLIDYTTGSLEGLEVTMPSTELRFVEDLAMFTSHLINNDTSHWTVMATEAINRFEKTHMLDLPWNQIKQNIQELDYSPNSPWKQENPLRTLSNEQAEDYSEVQPSVIDAVTSRATYSQNEDQAVALAMIARIQRDYHQFVPEFDNSLKQLDPRELDELYFHTIAANDQDPETIAKMLTIVQSMLGEQVGNNYQIRLTPSTLFPDSLDILLKPINALSQ